MAEVQTIDAEIGADTTRYLGASILEYASTPRGEQPPAARAQIAEWRRRMARGELPMDVPEGQMQPTLEEIQKSLNQLQAVFAFALRENTRIVSDRLVPQEPGASTTASGMFDTNEATELEEEPRSLLRVMRRQAEAAAAAAAAAAVAAAEAAAAAQAQEQVGAPGEALPQ